MEYVLRQGNIKALTSELDGVQMKRPGQRPEIISTGSLQSREAVLREPTGTGGEVKNAGL